MTRCRSFTRRTSRVAVLAFGAALTLVSQVAYASHSSFTVGDVFVSLSDGRVEWHHPDGTLNRILPTAVGGHGEGMAFDAPMNLYVTHLSPGDTVETWDTQGNNTGTFGGVFGIRYDCNPRDIVFDDAGNAYVGQMDCERDILKFNSSGTLLASYNAATEVRGTDWIDLAPNQCTMFYTSQSVNVKRFNVCTNTQLANFNTAPLPFDLLAGSAANGIKILPDGGVIVANVTEIVRLDAAGNQVRTYDAAGAPSGWLGLDLDVDGTSFWAGNHANNTVYKFDLATGAVTLTFHTQGPPKGVIVKKPPREAEGRMTGGGSVIIDDGTRVTHGFELHCDATDPPNSLEVNTHPEGGGPGGRFHLLSLTSASCTDDPTIEEKPPVAGFDTYTGTGTGRWNGVDGATAEWTFTDAGEPGVNDKIFNMTIRDSSGTIVLQVTNEKLTFGNHQAHKK